jgi:hypothetical protein
MAGSTDPSSNPDAPAVGTRSEEDGLPDTSTSHTSKEKEKAIEREMGEDSIFNPLLQIPQEQELGTLSVPLSAPPDRSVAAE